MMKMRETQREAYKARALEAINIARRALGKEPLEAIPLGQPQQSCGCPISRALGNAHVTQFAVVFDSNEITAEQADALVRAWNTSPLIGRPWFRDVDLPGGLKTFVKARGCRRIELPGVLKTFVKAFDEGDFLELVG